MFSLTSQAGKAMARRTVWTINVRATVHFAIAFVVAVALLALLHRGPMQMKWSQVRIFRSVYCSGSQEGEVLARRDLWH